MFTEILELYQTRPDFFLQLALEHLRICGTAIAIAFFIGTILGIFISQYRQFSSFIIGTTNVIYTIPSIALLGFLIPVSGIGNTTAIIALTVYGLLPIVRNTYTGLVNIDASIIEAAKGMGSTPWQILYKIKLPLALPVILSGLKNMVVMTIALGGIASFIGAGGLGVAIFRGITINNLAMTVAGSLIIALMALFFDFLIGSFEKFIYKKRRMKRI